ncbi:MAG TPA: right-handed parallel beta-helix repeat-containing protein [bacterium]|nr:right-handed parallel beta-helix repeat-containing protein [bacterium]
MNRTPFLMLFLMLIINSSVGTGALAAPADKTAVFYVSTAGNDGFSGKYAEPRGADDGPFATLERARDAIRSMKKAGPLPNGGVTVFIRGGVYFLKNTFTLTDGDGGLDAAPIVYRAYEKEEVRLVGGAALNPAWFSPVNDPAVLGRIDEKVRGAVLQTDLGAHGISPGILTPRGFGRPVRPAAIELFFNGRPLQLARTPNKAWARIASVPDGQKGARFAYSGDAPKNWAPSPDLWVHGYWTYDWADSYVKVKSIDPVARIITTEEPYGVYGYSPGKRFRFLNALEALDAPGEWYADRASGLLYIYPPAPLVGGELIASTLEAPVVSLKDVSNVTLRGLTIEITRGAGVEITGGAKNLVAGCVVRNTGNGGVVISGGSQNGVTGSDVYETGDDGVRLTGGDRKMLAPAGNFASNNDIHNFGRWVRTYTPGVLIQGVGNRIEHNLVHDAPHVGILLNGNDHTIEYNEVHDINWETNDVGGFYLGRDWTERGNVVRYNFFHHIHAMNGGMPGVDSNTVYLDDCACGVNVYGNVFYKMNRGVFIGGGRDNTVENNIFVEAEPAVLVDSRCLGWASDTVKPGGTLHKRLLDMNYTQPPYSTRYPELVKILDDSPGAPKGNKIIRNISVKSTFLKLQDVDSKLLVVQDNLVDTDPQFVDAASMNFQLRDDSPAFALGFKKIPFADIGPYVDMYRSRLPERK